jgi:hypothetical protein
MVREQSCRIMTTQTAHPYPGAYACACACACACVHVCVVFVLLHRRDAVFLSEQRAQPRRNGREHEPPCLLLDLLSLLVADGCARLEQLAVRPDQIRQPVDLSDERLLVQSVANLLVQLVFDLERQTDTHTHTHTHSNSRAAWQ